MSLRLRLLAAFAYVLVLVVVALEVPLALNFSRRVDTEVKAEAATRVQVVAATASGRLQDPRRLDGVVRRAGGTIGGRVIVVDGRGRLLADSAGSGLRLRSYASRPEIREALAGRTAQGIRHSDSLGEDLLVTAVPIVDRGRAAGAVRASQSVAAVRAEVRRDITALVLIGLAVLALGLVVAWLLASSLARPLAGLARTARRVAAGELGARAEVTGSAEQREVATSFNEMTERLAQSIAAQRDFVANASHGLRTPLTGLRLRLEAAAQKSADPSVARDLEAAEREVERLADLVTDLLTLARDGERPEAGAPVSLAAAGTAAAERWTAIAAGAGCELAPVGEGDPNVSASGEDLAVVLDNLVENALGHAPAGSTVEIGWGASGGRAWIAVSDEGPGLAGEDEQRAFERFYRGSSYPGRPGGTGLGLAIVAALARRWGGGATLRNREGGGARAEVWLPLSAAPAPPPAREEAPAWD